MNPVFKFSAKRTGSSMIEVLVTLVILLLGLLGLAGLMMQSQRAESESYQRVQALVYLQDMVGRINANRTVAACYAITTASDGTPFLGNGSEITSPTCTTGTATQNAQAIQDLTDWQALLLGATETVGAANAGGILGARGCVIADTATTPTTYLVSVAWQGMGKTAAPPAAWPCAKDRYGDDAQRRVVSASLKLAALVPPPAVVVP